MPGSRPGQQPCPEHDQDNSHAQGNNHALITTRTTTYSSQASPQFISVRRMSTILHATSASGPGWVRAAIPGTFTHPSLALSFCTNKSGCGLTAPSYSLT